jgi:hypothetical protein
MEQSAEHRQSEIEYGMIANFIVIKRVDKIGTSAL